MSVRTRNNSNQHIVSVPGNPNLTVHQSTHFDGLDLLPGVGAFCSDYLNTLHDTTFKALAEHPRTLAIRFDLRLPSNYHDNDHTLSMVITRLFQSLNAKINHDRSRAKRNNLKSHPCTLRYVWARESTGSKPHWHCVIFLNRDAYHKLGAVDSDRETVRSRIQAAWCSALGASWEKGCMLPYFPANPCYEMTRVNQGLIHGLPEFFQRASYLCKVDTKQFGQKVHAFGASRR